MLENLEPVVNVLPCKVRTILKQLDTKDAEILTKALTDDRWTPYALSKALAERGLALSDKVISKHQLKACSCSKIGN